MSSFYLAARFSRRAELRNYRTDLRQLGHSVTSSWIDLQDDSGNPRECAINDFRDVLASDGLIVFVDAPRYDTRGAHHCEFGIALALGRRLIIVGSRSHVFHYMPTVEFYPTWPAAMSRIATIPTTRDRGAVRRALSSKRLAAQIRP
jgi:hypothetical protein